MLFISEKFFYLSNDILIEFMGVDYEKYIWCWNKLYTWWKN
jgi:hypothetical protein